MAAAIAPVPLVVTLPAGPAIAEDPLLLPAAHPLVAATARLDWQPAPAVAGMPPQVSAPLYQVVYAFGARCKTSPAPADQAAARNASVFTLRLTGGAWSRILFQLHASGLGLDPTAPPYVTVAHIRDAVSKLTLTNPLDMLVVAADWAPSPGLAAPGGAGAGPVRLRRHLAEIAFLRVDIPSLEIRTGPRATNAPWAAISLLAGALGPVGTNAARLAGYPTSTATVAAAELRGTSTAGDAVLSSALRQTLVGALLPPELHPHSADATTVFEELRDGLTYRANDAGRQMVEESRAYFLAPWCGLAPLRASGP